MQRICLWFLLIALTGCASAPAKPQDQKPVAQEEQCSRLSAAWHSFMAELSPIKFGAEAFDACKEGNVFGCVMTPAIVPFAFFCDVLVAPLILPIAASSPNIQERGCPRPPGTWASAQVDGPSLSNAGSSSVPSNTPSSEELGPSGSLMLLQHFGIRSETENGCHIAWVVSGDAGSKAPYRVFLDGRSGPPYTGGYDPVFSADGKHFAFVAEEEEKMFVVVDGKRGATYPIIHKGGPVLSSDGNHVSYVVRQDKQDFVVTDGVPGPHYDRIYAGSVRFSPDGKHLAHSALKGRKRYIVVDGVPGPSHDSVGESPVLSVDGKRLAYIVINGDKQFVMIDGKADPEYDAILLDSPVFSPDGKHLAYSARVGNRKFVVIDGVKGVEYDGIGQKVVTFSTDGRHTAYRAQIGNKVLVVIDGVPSRVYDNASDPVFSGDGGRVAYIAKDGGKSTLVADGMPGPEYDEIYSPVFSSDGKKLAYGARKKGTPLGKDDYLVVLEGQPVPATGAIVCGPVFLPDGTLEYLQSDGTHLYRVRK
ncbi:hypothetical protein [Geomonas sp.]|uniref:hypothetical protein n=1 Tax=Geomonas sp. TaxID=2651584 RepID=UPI002B474CF7|nr:hypothetical protein [Geomonas sp.]HJV36738.1 hypothetical protein [Geomonas sp.]